MISICKKSVVNRQNGLRKRLNERIKSVAAVDVASRDTWRQLVAQLSLGSSQNFYDNMFLKYSDFVKTPVLVTLEQFGTPHNVNRPMFGNSTRLKGRSENDADLNELDAV